MKDKAEAKRQKPISADDDTVRRLVTELGLKDYDFLDRPSLSTERHAVAIALMRLAALLIERQADVVRIFFDHVDDGGTALHKLTFEFIDWREHR